MRAPPCPQSLQKVFRGSIWREPSQWAHAVADRTPERAEQQNGRQRTIQPRSCISRKLFQKSSSHSHAMGYRVMTRPWGCTSLAQGLHCNRPKASKTSNGWGTRTSAISTQSPLQNWIMHLRTPTCCLRGSAGNPRRPGTQSHSASPQDIYIPEASTPMAQRSHVMLGKKVHLP